MRGLDHKALRPLGAVEVRLNVYAPRFGMRKLVDTLFVCEDQRSLFGSVPEKGTELVLPVEKIGPVELVVQTVQINLLTGNVVLYVDPAPNQNVDLLEKKLRERKWE